MRMHSERAHSFASMIGLAPRAKRAEGEDKPKEVEDDARAARAEGDDASPPKDKPDAQRAEGDDKPKEDPEARAEGEDGDDCPSCDGTGEDDDGDACDACDGTGKKAKKAKAAKAKSGAKAEGDDNKDEQEKGAKAERKRWGFVMAKAIPEGKALAACALLHDTPMAAAKIVETLAALPAADTAHLKAQGLRDRMATTTQPKITPDGPSGGESGATGPKAEVKGIVARMLAAGAKARGETPKPA